MKCNYWIVVWLFVSSTACVSEQESHVTKDNTEERPQSSLHNTRFLQTVDAVKERLTHPDDIVVFEISTSDKYQQGHLPNARHLWRPDYENHKDYPYGGMMASREEMQVLLSEQGVSSTTEIILYDTKGSVDAMRVLWILRNYGHHKVTVMDGGKVAWLQAGYALSKTIPEQATIANYLFSEEEMSSSLATMNEVLAALNDTNVILLDTREPEEFEGKPYLHKGKLVYYKKGAFTSGCIPGAVHFNWSDAVDLKGDHCFKSLKALRYNFMKKGITPNKQIITYCQSGVRSAHTTFVLTELLGFPDVKNYDGSWIEWSYHHQKDENMSIQQHTAQAEVTAEYNRLMDVLAQE